MYNKTNRSKTKLMEKHKTMIPIHIYYDSILINFNINNTLSVNIVCL